ncbi:GDP-L-galactose phosphorylase 1-like isoform X2 [Ananas comosus]|uniref:GDP-L-galactose phosphorylase 1-like isoform X2 n=1 Tax=Ananas comosus TaxID=4615 RepID=A0A6P5F9Z1_ANACO|nr:GDP-L-galactose phosphorylase 1-like isoform X2 [Ananas comosus]
MVSVTQVEGEYPFLRQNSSSEQSKGDQVPPKGIKTHLYSLGVIPKDNDACGGSFTAEDSQSLLDTFLLSQWEYHAWRGQLEYDVTACEFKVISGRKKFIVQLNNRWNAQFLKEFENNFLEPLRFMKSNYMKNCKEEILFCVCQGEKESSELLPLTVLPKDGVLIIANANYFANPLPVELFPTISAYEDVLITDTQICEVMDYPLKTLVFMSKNLKSLVALVTKICSTLHSQNTAFNLLITDCGTKIYLFPQVKNVTMECQLFPWECGGYFVCNNEANYENISETEISKHLASVSLDDGSFKAFKHVCFSIAVNLVD